MRDEQVLALNARNAQNVATIYRQVGFLNSRMEAFENVLKASRLIDRLKWLLWPMDLIKAVNSAHLALMKQRDDEVRESRERIEAERKKPKIQIVGANGAFH